MSRKTAPSETDPLLETDDHHRHCDAPGAAEQGEEYDNVDITEDDKEESLSSNRNNLFQVVAVVYSFFYLGVLLTAMGALFEYVMLYHQISSSTASLIFPTMILGYVCSAMCLSAVTARAGWRGVAVIAPVLHIPGTLLLGMGVSFPSTLVGYFLTGLGSGLADAGFNAWASRLKSAIVVQGFNHSGFALGCVAGPILTLAVTGRQLPWFVFYRAMAVLSVLELITLSIAFRRHERAEFNGTKAKNNRSSLTTKTTTTPTTSVTIGTNDPNKSIRFKAIRLVVGCSLYYFVYTGVENCMNSWIVLYMKRVRNTDQTHAALSSSIFWIGIAFGRAAHAPLTARLGTRAAVFWYVVGAIGSDALFLWRTTPTTANNIFTSFTLLALTGIFMGPLYPSAMIFMAQQLPLKEAVAAVSTAVAMGQVGGAVSAFGVGVMIDKIGLRSSFDVTLYLLILLVVVWVVFSRYC